MRAIGMPIEHFAKRVSQYPVTPRGRVERSMTVQQFKQIRSRLRDPKTMREIEEFSALAKHKPALSQLSESGKSRTLNQLENDKTLPSYVTKRCMETNRYAALYQVLSSMPNKYYDALLSRLEGKSIYYYMPDSGILGSVKDMPEGVVYVYLAASLEDKPHGEIEYCVAHEFAHIILNHFGHGPEMKEKHEQEADRVARLILGREI